MTTNESAQFLKLYRPSAGRKPDCGECEKEDCMNRDRFQRNRRDLSVAAGRCPRLPDEYGEHDPDYYDLAEEDNAALEQIARILLRRRDSPQDIAEALNITEPK